MSGLLAGLWLVLQQKDLMQAEIFTPPQKQLQHKHDSTWPKIALIQTEGSQGLIN